MSNVGASLFDSDDEVAPAGEAELKINKQYAKKHEDFSAKEMAQTLKDRQDAIRVLECASDSEEEEDLEEEKMEVFKVIQQSLVFDEVLGSKEIKSNETCHNSEKEKEEVPILETKQKTRKKKKKKITLEIYRQQLLEKIASGEVPEYESDHDAPPPLPKSSIISLFDDDKPLNFEDLFVSQDKVDRREEEELVLEEKNTNQAENLLQNVQERLKNPELSDLDKLIVELQSEYILSTMAPKKKNKNKSKNDDVKRNKKEKKNVVDEDEKYSKEEEEDVDFRKEEKKTENIWKTIQEAAKLFPSDDTPKPLSYPKMETAAGDNKRKDAREKRKERKEAEMSRMKAEVKELETEVQKIWKAKLQKIKDITGQDKLGFEADYLDDDFDAEEHDRKMQERYNDEYYSGEYDDKKPTFDYDEEIDGKFKDYDEFHDNEDDHGEEEGMAAETVSQDTHEGNDMTAMYSSASFSTRRQKGRSKKFTEALLQDKLDSLDFEDIIGGDIKCRFKYKTVEPNDFGLSTEEILMADNKELNKFYSLKRILRNDRTAEQEKKDRKLCAKKAGNEEYMRNNFPSLYQEDGELTDNVDESVLIDELQSQKIEEEKKKKKNLKKKLRREEKKIAAASTMKETSETINSTEEIATKTKAKTIKDDKSVANDIKPLHVEKRKKRKRLSGEQFNNSKKRKMNSSKKGTYDEHLRRKANGVLNPSDPLTNVLQISNERLAAYGLPAPVKIKKKIVHLQKQERKGAIKDALGAFRYSSDKKKVKKKKIGKTAS